MQASPLRAVPDKEGWYWLLLLNNLCRKSKCTQAPRRGIKKKEKEKKKASLSSNGGLLVLQIAVFPTAVLLETNVPIVLGCAWRWGFGGGGEEGWGGGGDEWVLECVGGVWQIVLQSELGAGVKCTLPMLLSPPELSCSATSPTAAPPHFSSVRTWPQMGFFLLPVSRSCRCTLSLQGLQTLHSDSSGLECHFQVKTESFTWLALVLETWLHFFVLCQCYSYFNLSGEKKHCIFSFNSNVFYINYVSRLLLCIIDYRDAMDTNEASILILFCFYKNVQF